MIKLTPLAAVAFFLAACGGGSGAQEIDRGSAVGAASPPPRVTPDIVGGEDARQGAWPYAAYIELVKDVDDDGVPDLNQNGQVARRACGGSLVGPRWVLTAAHCTNSTLSATVWIGEVNKPWTRPELRYQGSVADGDFWSHPDYVVDTYENDVALIRLDRAASQPGVVFVLSDDDRLWAPGVLASIIGWGRTTQGGVSSDSLKQARVPIVGDDDCTTSYGAEFLVASMFCAGVPEGGVDTCQGDSGGPILVPVGREWVQAGVVSWGRGCAQPGFPGVYSRLERLSESVVSRLESDTEAPVAGPSIQTARATEVRRDGATIESQVQTAGLAAIVMLEIRKAGDEAAKWTIVSTRNTHGDAPETNTFEARSLEPGTTYEFRVSAASATGHVASAARTFDTAD